MFQSARVKLTAWYLLIIMLISVMFSIAIYQVLGTELTRFAIEQQRRLERQRIYLGYPLPPTSQELFAPELLEESKNRLKLILILINGSILLISGGASYFLAGRTLRPIEAMMEDQKQFVADASHELRTPLTAMRSETEVALRDKKLTLSDAKAMLHSNLEEVNKLQLLSDYLLRLSRYQHTASEIAFSNISLDSTVAQVVDELKPLAYAKSNKISTSFDKVTIFADQKSMAELATVLIENAIKFSNENGVVEVATKAIDNSAILTVTDHGTGIEPEEIDHIFNRFYQSDKSRSSEKGGYGLGLAIAKKIVEMHHGSIQVTSTPNTITTFTVRLPLAFNAQSQT